MLASIDDKFKDLIWSPCPALPIPVELASWAYDTENATQKGSVLGV